LQFTTHSKKGYFSTSSLIKFSKSAWESNINFWLRYRNAVFLLVLSFLYPSRFYIW
jgi:hypothetical protein